MLYYVNIIFRPSGGYRRNPFMTPQHIDRRRLKAEMKETVRTAQVSAKAMTALYLGLTLLLSLINYVGGSREGMVSLFLTILVQLLGTVLSAGFILYCMAILRGERAEFLYLFDGFSLAGKIICLEIIKLAYIMLWSMFFIVPGIIAAYRYRFAAFNLYENPDLGVFRAMELSKRQTMGYKQQLFMLDLSYFGWACLAILPVMAESYLYSFEAAAVMMGMEPFLPVLTDGQYLIWLLASGLWQLGVSLFYLPVYHCAELGYYETAKATSGLDPVREFSDRTPDGL